MNTARMGKKNRPYHRYKKIIDQRTSKNTTTPAHHHTKISGTSMVLASVGYVYPPMTVISVGVTSYSILPILQQSIKIFRQEKRITSDSYTAIVATLLLIMGNAFAAAMQSMLYHFSHHLIEQSRANSLRLTSAAYHQTPETVWVLTDTVEQQIPLAQLKVGDAVIVTTGETIPVDGTVVTGTALIDQQALTGEANPIEKTQDDTVMAATIVLNGRLVLRALHSGEQTRIHKLNELLAQTHDYKTSLQLKGEAWANHIALPLIAGSAMISPIVGTSTALALLFSAPLNVVRSMLSVQTSTQLQALTEQGMLIKDGRILEELPKIDTILFDKTGTLTHSQPEVTQIISCADYDADTLLGWAAAAEQRLEHPIAKAIVHKAQQHALVLAETESEQSQYDLGLGVTVTIDGHIIQVGSQRFIEQATKQNHLPTVITEAMQAAIGHTFIFIAVDHDIAGVLELQPRLRAEVPQLIADLRQHGFQQLMLVSGDQQAPTERLAKQLQLDQAFGEVLPQQKAELIKQLQAEGRHVCFIGDGLNDAIALKQANVSVCLSSATPISYEVAQVVMLNDRLTHFSTLFDAATRLHKRLGNSLYLWIGFGASNALAVPLLGFGPLQSSLLFGAAFSAGLKMSKTNLEQEDTIL